MRDFKAVEGVLDVLFFGTTFLRVVDFSARRCGHEGKEGKMVAGWGTLEQCSMLSCSMFI